MTRLDSGYKRCGTTINLKPPQSVIRMVGSPALYVYEIHGVSFLTYTTEREHACKVYRNSAEAKTEMLGKAFNVALICEPIGTEVTGEIFPTEPPPMKVTGDPSDIVPDLFRARKIDIEEANRVAADIGKGDCAMYCGWLAGLLENPESEDLAKVATILRGVLLKIRTEAL